MIESFPKHYDAPVMIQNLEGNCGILTAWGVLRYFKKRASAKSLIETAGHSREGTFMIGLAVCLRKNGLGVEFISEPDNEKTATEKRLYETAVRIGIEFREALDIDTILEKLSNDSIPIVLYDTPDGEGHITPLLGTRKGKLIAIYTDEGTITKGEFLRGWRRPKVLRQAIVARR